MSSEKLITRENYEVFFLDYLEGRLEEPLRTALMAFLDDHPDLAGELEDLDKTILPADAVSFHIPKDALKRAVIPVGDIHEGNVEEFLVASGEGDLGADEEANLAMFLEKNPAYRHDRELFMAAVVEPAQEIICPNKEKLYKGRGVVLPFRRMAAAAAAAVLLIMLGWRFFFQPPIEPPIIPATDLQVVTTPVEMTAPLFMDPVPAHPVALAPASAPALKSRPAIGPIVRSRLLTLSPKELAPMQRGNYRPYLVQRFYTAGALAKLQAYVQEPDEGKMLDKVIRNFSERTRDGLQALRRQPEEKERNVNFWDLADLGLQGYNKLMDREVELEVVRDRTGNAAEYTFSESGNVLISSERGQE